MTEEITSVEPDLPTPEGASDRKLDGWEKTAVEMGPLVPLMLGYWQADRLGPPLDGLFGTTLFSSEDAGLYVGLALFLPVLVLAVAWSMIRVRRVAPILLVTAVIVVVLGAFTFALQDKRFFYVKPTIIYGLTAAALTGGLLAGRNFLRLLFDGAFELPDAVWRTLTWRFVWFNAGAAVLNEVLWRTLTAGCEAGAECAGEATWLNIKVFGFTAVYFAFILAQMPLLMRHMEAGAGDVGEDGDEAGDAA